MQLKITEEIGQVRITTPWNSSVVGEGNPEFLFLIWLCLVGLGIWGVFFAPQDIVDDVVPFGMLWFFVWVTISLALYLSICGRVNQQEIIITDDGSFTLREFPLPSLHFGFTFGPFRAAEIKQFYIRNFNSEHKRSVGLFIRRTNGMGKQLVLVPIDKYMQLRELETILEQRLGIHEQKMKAEFRPGILGEAATPRPASYHAQTTGPFVQRLNYSTTNTLKIGDKTWDIHFVQQYDWESGETSYFLHLGYGSASLHLYQDTNRKWYERKPLGLKAKNQLGLRIETNDVVYHAHLLQLVGSQSGMAFRTLQQHQPGIPCQAYRFIHSETRQMIRVIRFQNMLEVYNDNPFDTPIKEPSAT